MAGSRVITIATATGALAEEAGGRVAAELGFRSINEQIIDRAAREAGVTRAEIDRVEHSEPMLERVMTLLSSMATPGVSDWGWIPEAPYKDPTPGYRRLIRQVIEEVAIDGNAVIVAHGAGLQLAGRAGVLRVFVTGSPGVRAQRVAAERSCSIVEANAAVEHTDRERAAYLRRFYGVRRELPEHYDLVVNTDNLDASAAARIIVQAATLIARGGDSASNARREFGTLSTVD